HLRLAWADRGDVARRPRGRDRAPARPPLLLPARVESRARGGGRKLAWRRQGERATLARRRRRGASSRRGHGAPCPYREANAPTCRLPPLRDRELGSPW